MRAFSEAEHSGPPARLGQRYRDGGFLPDPGNTVVCHLDRAAPGADAILAARREMQALPGADRLLFTPEASLHMTVFEGVLDNRRHADAWPAWLDKAAPLDAVSDAMEARLGGFEGPGGFAVAVAGLGPNGLALRGASGADEARMRAWRNALADVFGYRHKTHDSYGFHMTFAYPLAWFPEDLVPVWEAALGEICARLQAAVPVVPLNPPAFCRFADMTWFEERVVLA